MTYITCPKGHKRNNEIAKNCPVCEKENPSKAATQAGQNKGGGSKPKKYLCPKCGYYGYAFRYNKKHARCDSCGKRIY